MPADCFSLRQFFIFAAGMTVLSHGGELENVIPFASAASQL
jgi:hypothetical protein